MKSPGRTSFKVRPGRRSDGVGRPPQVGLLLTTLFAAQAPCRGVFRFGGEFTKGREAEAVALRKQSPLG